MAKVRHRMETVTSGFLTIPEKNDTTMKTLRHKLRLLAVRTLLNMPSPSGAMGTTLRATQRCLTEALRSKSKTILDLFNDPEICTPLLCYRSGLSPLEQTLQHILPHLVGQMHPHPPIVVEFPVARFFNAHHAVFFSPPIRAMMADKQGIEIELEGGKRTPIEDYEHTPRMWPLVDGFSLARFDYNPLRMMEAHPEKSGNALSLGGQPVDYWEEQLCNALSLIKATLPTFYAEMGTTLQRIVPVGYEPELHLSASYREAPGTIYMTVHPNPVTLAEAIIHEVQHGKLNTLSWFDRVLDNGMTEWTTSPVRPDLRPLWGVLLAVHAFVPVALMHHQLRQRKDLIGWFDYDQTLAKRQQEVLMGNENGLQILKEKARPTEIGQRVLNALTRIHESITDQNIGSLDGTKEFVLPPG